MRASAIEQVGAVLQRAGHARPAVVHVERQIELGDAVVDVDRLHAESLEAEARFRRVRHHHLEQRRAAQVARRMQLFDQLLERQVLVRVGPQRGLPYPPERLAESRIARQIGPHDERVDEEADHAFDLQAVSVGDRSSDQDVVLPRVALQEDHERRQDRHERRGPFPAAEGLQRFRQPFRQIQPATRAAVARRGWAGPIGRQIEDHWRPRQRLPPVPELGFQGLAPQPAALPRREVGVLDRQGGKRRRPALSESGVQRPQLSRENPLRPAVGDDVVERQEEDVVLWLEAEKTRPQQGPRRQIERRLGLLARPAQRLRPALRGREPGEILDGHLQPQLRGHHGDRSAVDARKGGPQDLVAADDFVEARRERRHDQAAAQAQRARSVVERVAGLELVEKPQPLLRERERALPVGRSGDRLRRGRPAFPPRRGEVRGKPLHRRRLEQGAQRELDAEALPHP